MNHKVTNTDDRILQFLDGQLPKHDQEQFEVLLKADHALRQRFAELKLIHNHLTQAVLENPSSQFTARVMSNLGSWAAPVRLSPKNGLMLLMGVVVALMLGVYALSSGWFLPLTGQITLEQLQVPKTVINIPLPAIPFNGGVLIKVLIGLNLVIAFSLLDKTIIQPYFQNRLRKLNGEKY
jgi:anti-sigma factor RsiW